MSNEDDEFMRMAEECRIEMWYPGCEHRSPYERQIIALCKKVQDKQREKDVRICEAVRDSNIKDGAMFYAGGCRECAETIRNSKGE
jgi:hypothetical protein